MNKFFGKSSKPDVHLDEELLFQAFNGSASAGESQFVAEHLEHCWRCKEKWENWSQARSDYMYYKHLVQEQVAAPPKNWASFSTRLRNLSQTEKVPARWQIFEWRMDWQHLRESFLLRGIAFGVMAILVALLFFDISFFNHDSVVSASELITQAASREDAQIRSVSSPVVCQKLKTKIQGGSYTRTIYRDLVKNRVVDQIESEDGQLNSKQDAELAHLQRTFVAAKLSWEAPLSPQILRQWRSSVSLAEEHVSVDSDKIELVETAKNSVISRAKVVFRKSDLHPLAESLYLNDGTEVEIAELDFKVVNLSSLNENVFTEDASRPAIAPELSFQKTSFDVVNLAVQVLDRLDQADALVEDHIEVNHDQERGVIVSGVVATEKRKQQLLNQLAGVSGFPGDHIHIQSTDEVRQLIAVGPVTEMKPVEIVEQERSGEQLLRNYFARQGSTGDELEHEVQSYSAKLFEQSNKALVHAVLASQLLDRFSVSEAAAMTFENRERLQAICQHHTSLALNGLRQLFSDLQPLTTPSLPQHSPERISGDFRSDSRKLAFMVAEIDRDLGRALANSATSETSNPISSPEFSENLIQAQSLALGMLEQADKHKEMEVQRVSR